MVYTFNNFVRDKNAVNKRIYVLIKDKRDIVTCSWELQAKCAHDMLSKSYMCTRNCRRIYVSVFRVYLKDFAEFADST